MKNETEIFLKSSDLSEPAGEIWEKYTMLAARCETFHGDKCVVFGWYKTIFMLKMKNNKRKRALKREVR